MIPPFYYHIGLGNKIFIYLARYLNEILKLNPPLAEKEVFDKELSDAVMKFRLFYNSQNPQKKLPIILGMQNEVWAAIGVMLGTVRLRQEIATLRDPVVVKLLQGIPPLIIPPYSAEMAACDIKLAQIFGGVGAVAAGNGFEPPNKVGNRSYRGGESGHLSDRAMHLYGDNEGTKITSVFIPKGFEKPIYPNPRTLPEYVGGSFIAYYKRLGSVNNVSLITTHLANFTKDSSITNNAGSYLHW